MGDENPWVVESIETFSFYCCPECDFKSKDGDYFKRHAMESHIKSKVFLIISKSETTTNKDPLEVETESDYQKENEEGMNDFDVSETRVKCESEEFEKVSENQAQKLNNGPDLEIFNDKETDKIFEDNLNTMDDQEAGKNVEELDIFYHELESEGNKEQATTFDEDNNSITGKKKDIIEGEKKRNRDLDVKREKKKKKIKSYSGYGRY